MIFQLFIWFTFSINIIYCNIEQNNNDLSIESFFNDLKNGESFVVEFIRDLGTLIKGDYVNQIQL